MKIRSKISKSKPKKRNKNLRRNGLWFIDMMNKTGKYDPWQKKSSITEEERQRLLKLEAEKYSTLAGYVERSEGQFWHLMDDLRQDINKLHEKLLISGIPKESKKLDDLLKYAYNKLMQLHKQILTGELPKAKEVPIG